MIRKKILLLGDFNVGKTSLIRRYVDNAFDDSYLTTIGVKISKKRLLLEEETYELLIWDIEGATPQKSIPQSYYRGACGAIFVADVTREDTLDGIQDHITYFEEINPNVAYVVAFNKSDLLTEEEQNSLSSKNDIFFTSAKNNTNVEILFTTLTKKMIR